MSFDSDRQRSRAALEAQGRRLEDDLGEALAAFAIAEQPPEFITEHPLPDLTELNKAVPQKFLRKGLNGQLDEEPWKRMLGLVFFDPQTGTQWVYANHTDGCRRAINDLANQVAAHRFMTGGNEVPVVVLGNAPMPPRVRPALKVIDWVRLPTARVWSGT
jgi:hypothetical protein